MKDHGFSLIELLVATTLTLVISGALVAAVNPARLIADAQPEAMDMQQGARFVVAVLTRDLHLAGAGLDRGSAAGSLINSLPPIIPRRIGARDADPSTVARPDAFSVVWVPRTNGQASLAAPFDGGQLVLGPAAACVPASAACGFSDGAGLLLFDRTGRFDLFTTTTADTTGLFVRRRNAGAVVSYPAGAIAAEVMARTYYFDPAVRQLRQYDTDLADTPVLDDVVSMRVEYFGSAAAPSAPKPPAGVANCLFDAAGTQLPFPITHGPGGDSVPLPLETFRDGPWCGTGGIEFDADLLRVRRVRVTVAIQASVSAMRGRGIGFASGGANVSVWNRLADMVVAVDVSPRNLTGEVEP